MKTCPALLPSHKECVHVFSPKTPCLYVPMGIEASPCPRSAPAPHFMDGHPVFWPHLVKFIDAHHAIVCQHHGSTLQVELAAGGVLQSPSTAYTAHNAAQHALQMTQHSFQYSWWHPAALEQSTAWHAQHNQHTCICCLALRFLASG